MPAMASVVPRRIVSFSRDPSEAQGWIAQLDCGHRRHVVHRPPLSSYPWVDDPVAREAHVGQAIECGRCVQRIWPDHAAPAHKQTRTFTQADVPSGLLGEHRTKARVWGRLEVLSGQLSLCFDHPLAERVPVGAGETAAIPPELVHHVELDGPVEFRVAFHRCGDVPVRASEATTLTAD